MSRHGLVLALLIGGCGEAPVPDTAAQAAVRARVSVLLDRTKALTYEGCGPIPDGGSLIYEFSGDDRSRISLMLLHRDPDMGGNARFQVVRFLVPGCAEEVTLHPDSLLEDRLIALLSGLQHPDIADLLARIRRRERSEPPFGLRPSSPSRGKGGPLPSSVFRLPPSIH